MDISVDYLGTTALAKADLAKCLFEQIGLNKREANDMVDAFFDLVTDRLVDGENVKIPGFGNLQIRTKADRLGRNPRTGEPAVIRARRVVTFQASSKLRGAMDDRAVSDQI